MKQAEINPFIPENHKGHKTKTLLAIYGHFCEGKTVAEAANAAGISRGTAEEAIAPIRAAVLKAGWEKVYKRTVIYRRKK